MAYNVLMVPQSLLAAGMNADGMTAKPDGDSCLSSQGNKTYKLTLSVMCVHTSVSSCWLISAKAHRRQKVSGRISS